MFKIGVKMKNEKKELNHNLIILGIAVLMVSPILSSVYFGGGHDTEYHVANIKAIVVSIFSSDGIRFPQKVVPLIGNNLGYGSGIFYPKLPHYLAALVHIIIMPFTKNFDYTMNIVHFIVIYLSGVYMFKFSNVLFSDKRAALLSSALYMTFPYHLTDVYVRNAFSESFIFIFVPMVFLGIYYLVNNNKTKFYIYFVLGYVGGVYSHTVMMCYVTIFLLIAMAFNFRELVKKDSIFALIKASIVILLLISPSVLPLIQHKMYGSYSVFVEGSMGTGPSSVAERAMILSEYFDYGSYLQMGLVHLFACVIGCSYVLKTDMLQEKRVWAISIIVITILSFVMTLSVFPWVHMPSFLLKIQFPWRVQLILTFGMSILGGYALYHFENKNWKVICLIFIMLSSYTSLTFVNDQRNFEYYSWNQLDMNKGLSGAGDYLPTNAFNDDNYDYIMNRNNDIIVIDGYANIEQLKNETPYLKSKIDIQSDVATFELPRIYYLGYDITLDDGQSIDKIDYIENEKGLIEISLDKSGILEVKYARTTLNKIANVIFVITALLCIMWYCYTYRARILEIQRIFKTVDTRKKIGLFLICFVCIIAYCVQTKNYFSNNSVIERIAPLNIEYDLGSDIIFYGDEYNADKYILSGLGERGSEYSPIAGKTVEFEFRTQQNEPILEGTLDAVSLTGNDEKIIIYCNSQVVFDGILKADEKIKFNCVNDNKASNYYEMTIFTPDSENAIGFKDIAFRRANDSYSEYNIGSQMTFYDDGNNEYNGFKYIKSGFSGQEVNFTWTEATEAEIGFTIKSDAPSFTCNIDLDGVFNGEQKVTILINDNIVFDQTVNNDEDIQFNFDNSDDGIVLMKILLPEAVSPKDLGLSEDDRKLALGFRQIIINEN